MCKYATGVISDLVNEVDIATLTEVETDPLTEILSGVNEATPGTPEIKEVEEESHGNFLVIIILLCLLIPFLAILCFAIYIFRRNRLEEI